jgi:hypothetical protein
MITRALWMFVFAALALAPGCNSGGSGGAPDDKGCCPPDPTMSSCMHLGGYSPGGCSQTCDFFCSTNWRVETDAHGCSAWRYDTRAPQPGENQACLPALDGGGDG